MADLNNHDIDWQLLQQYREILGESGLQESVKMFTDIAPKYYAELEQHIVQQDEASVRSQAHKLKGSCRSLGFQRLGLTMAFIEKEQWQWQELAAQMQQWLPWFHQDTAIVNAWLQR